MIRHQDFVPRMVTPSIMFKPATFEPFEEALAEANQWISENQIQVVSVETVVLPNIWNRWEEGTKDPALGTGESPAHWHQFIRVWYRAGE
jgi:hypothetical protein